MESIIQKSEIMKNEISNNQFKLSVLNEKLKIMHPVNLQNTLMDDQGKDDKAEDSFLK